MSGTARRASTAFFVCTYVTETVVPAGNFVVDESRQPRHLRAGRGGTVRAEFPGKLLCSALDAFLQPPSPATGCTRFGEVITQLGGGGSVARGDRRQHRLARRGPQMRKTPPISPIVFAGARLALRDEWR